MIDPQDKPYWSLGPEELIQSKHSSPQGLTGEIARQKLGEAGYNLLVTKEKITGFKIFLSQFKSPIVIILLFATVVSMFVQEWVDAIIILAIGAAVGLPGWSFDRVWNALGSLLFIALLHIMLMPFVALFASAGRGYLPPLGWALTTLAFSQVAGVLGWGDWFPWSVPVLVSGMMGPRAARMPWKLEFISYNNIRNLRLNWILGLSSL